MTRILTGSDRSAINRFGRYFEAGFILHVIHMYFKGGHNQLSRSVIAQSV
jgi:hypothetical protein